MAVRRAPDWVFELINQLAGVAALPANWDSYGANPPNIASLGRAQEIVGLLGQIVGVERPDVSVSPEGNATLCWEWSGGKQCLDLEILADGVIKYCYTDDEGEDEEGNALRVERLQTS